MGKFSLSFHFNSFSYLCVALYIHFPYTVSCLLSSLWWSSQWPAIPTPVETKAIHHTNTQDPIRTRSNTSIVSLLRFRLLVRKSGPLAPKLRNGPENFWDRFAPLQRYAKINSTAVNELNFVREQSILFKKSCSLPSS